MNAIKPGTAMAVILGATALLADSGLCQYNELNLVDTSRRLSQTETQLIAALETIPGYLRGAVAADLDGDQRDEIVVMAKEVDSALLGDDLPVSGIVRVESRQIHYLFWFPPGYVNTDPVVADLNSDGVADLVYTAWGGGNGFNSAPQVVVWWDGDSFRHQNIGELRSVYDFDGDGALELETSVDLPEIARCSLDCDTAMLSARNIMYAPSMVWGWRDGVLRDISDEVPAFFREVKFPKLAIQRLELEESKQEIGTDEYSEVVDCLLECLELVERRAEDLAGEN